MIQFQKVRLIKHSIGNSPTNFQKGYWTEGTLLEDIDIGGHVKLARVRRADFEDYNKEVETPGIFETSVILEINGSFITTKNSIWEIKEL